MKVLPLKIPAVIDNTAPVLQDVSVSLMGDTMTVKASDNRYLAAAVLYNAGGTTALAFQGAALRMHSLVRHRALRWT